MLVNNRETVAGDKANYVDQDGRIHEAIILDVKEQDGIADLDVSGTQVTIVPHNTSVERHSWDHAVIQQDEH